MLGKLLFAILVTMLTYSYGYANATDAYIDTDKDEVSLGEDLTIRVAEPDANVDSRSMERIPLDTILIETNKFDETSLDKVLSKTGIRSGQSSLLETGFNTGIFEVTLESINSKLVDRGSQIRIIYFDNTPSGGGSAVRVQTVVQVVEAKIAVVFDRNEYSPFDEVNVKLVAQMFNVNRNKMDTLNTPTGNKVAVTTSSGQTYYPPMFETEINSGIFIGKIHLTSDKNAKDGDLVVTSGDRIVVTVVIIPGFQVSDSATIATSVGSVAFERSEYSIGDKVKIVVTDRDENRSSNAKDTVQVKVWSNTDIAGIQLSLQETQNISGVFEGMLILSSENSTESLRVSENDVLLALYKDRTVPLTEVKIKDLFATAKIGSVTSIMVSDPVVLDQDASVGNVQAGKEVTIQSFITNTKESREAFVYLVQIKDVDGFTSHLSLVSGMLEGYQSINVGRNWTPDMEGKYTIEVLLWSSLTEPSILSPVKKTMITVA